MHSFTHRMPRSDSAAKMITTSSHTDSRRDVKDISPTNAKSSMHQSRMDPMTMAWTGFPSEYIFRYGCVVRSNSTKSMERFLPSFLLIVPRAIPKFFIVGRIHALLARMERLRDRCVSCCDAVVPWILVDAQGVSSGQLGRYLNRKSRNLADADWPPDLSEQ